MRRTAGPLEVAYRYKLKRTRRLDALETLGVEFLERERVMHLSERTVQHHDFWLDRFCQWADARGVTSVHEVTRAVLVRFQRHLFYYRKKNGRPLSVASQENALTTLRAYFRHLTREGIVHANPAADLDTPRREQKLPRHVLTVSEVEQVMRAVDLDKPMGVRDRAILEVLYSTGLRRLELCGLLCLDVDEERGVLTVRQGKGKKDRVVPIGDRALAWVRRYRDELRPSIVLEPDEGWLFLNEDGDVLGPGWLSRVVNRHIERSGIEKKGSCHLFRHTMATLLLEGGADIRVIQEILGHANLQTTQIYTRVSIAKLKAVHAMAHPAHLERASAPPAESPKVDEGELRADLLAELSAECDDERRPEPPAEQSRPSPAVTRRVARRVRQGRRAAPPERSGGQP
jgi:integrase/recombinase XerD